MSKLEDRIAAAEEKLKTLKAQHVRAATKQRARDAKQQRRDDLRRKILVGAVVLDLVDRGEIKTALLAQWLKETLTRDEDRALFTHYWARPGDSISRANSTADDCLKLPANLGKEKTAVGERHATAHLLLGANDTVAADTRKAETGEMSSGGS